jgi:hypothetical protein
MAKKASTVEPSASTATVSPPPPAPPTPLVNGAPPESPHAVEPALTVHIQVYCGGISNLKVPIAVAPRYEGMQLAGPAKVFDGLLDSWLSRAYDLGMIGSGLGQVFPVNLKARTDLKNEYILLVGMGEPGQFAEDDLRFLLCNITVAVKALREHQFSTWLIGTRRNELTIDQAIRGLLKGLKDGFDRFRAIADAVTRNREQFQQAAVQKLEVALVEPDPDKARMILDTLLAFPRDGIQDLQLEVEERLEPLAPDPREEPTGTDVSPDLPVTMIRITRHDQAESGTARLGARLPEAGVDRDGRHLGAGSLSVPPWQEPNNTLAAPDPAAPRPFVSRGNVVLRFSALGEVAAVTVREIDVNPFIIQELPNRMAAAASAQEQERLGGFVHDYLLPEDLRRLTGGAHNLTFVVDETTAGYPWEMLAVRKHVQATFLGESVCLSRRFHSLLSPAPGSPPPLNNELAVLIIADPAPSPFNLPAAHDEGRAVLEILAQARQAPGNRFKITATVRIGSRKEEGLYSALYRDLRARGSWVDVASCDPLEIAMLIVSGHYDVIHYAGHGAFDGSTRRAGWVLDPDCFLSAQEIFRVRQVPRLVFANACFSAVTGKDRSEQRRQMVGVAQAFFERGIPNYIGTGWEVDDTVALVCARRFYTEVLGLDRPESPPATIGVALRKAREEARRTRPDSTSWGAYQHYGNVSDKLLPWHNVPAEPSPARP